MYLHNLFHLFLPCSQYNLTTAYEISDQYHDTHATGLVYTAMWQILLAMVAKAVLTIFTYGMKVRMYMYVQYTSKKPVRTCAKSTVAAVHINSRITFHARRSNGSYTALCAQRTKSSQSLVRGTAIVEAWVY